MSSTLIVPPLYYAGFSHHAAQALEDRICIREVRGHNIILHRLKTTRNLQGSSTADTFRNLFGLPALFYIA